MTAIRGDIRVRLRALGERRAKLDADERTLSDDVRRAIRDSYGRVPVAETARLLGVHRTTIYRVYGPQDG